MRQPMRLSAIFQISDQMPGSYAPHLRLSANGMQKLNKIRPYGRGGYAPERPPLLEIIKYGAVLVILASGHIVIDP